MKETTQTVHEKAVNRVVDYINQHLYSMPDINTLSDIANISGFHFHRIFKAIIGENIGEFIYRLRLEDIALRLLMRNDNLSDIAEQTGYASKHALSRAFKNHFGVSPSIYRSSPKHVQPFFGKDDRKEIIFNPTPEIRTIAPKTIVYVRIIDVYGAMKSYTEAWHKLGQFAKTNNLINDSVEFIGLSFDDPTITPPSKCRFYACFTPCKEVIPHGCFGVQQIPGGKYVVFTHHGAYHKLIDTYYNIYINWLPKSGLKLKSSLSFEKYLNSPKNTREEDLLTEIYVSLSR